MNVVDLGCATHLFSPKDESQNELIQRFQPDAYYGFDPHPNTPERHVSVEPFGVRIEIQRKAAWTYDGTIGLVLPPHVPNPLRTHVTEEGVGEVACFNLTTFLHDKGPLILKMDVEGAEHILLPHVFADPDAVSQISLLLIEWHGEPSCEIPVEWEIWE